MTPEPGSAAAASGAANEWMAHLAEVSSRPTRPRGSCGVCASIMVVLPHGEAVCGNSTSEWHRRAAERQALERGRS